MNLDLADYWQSHDRGNDAKRIWTNLYETHGQHFSRAGFRLAQQALQNKDLKTCLELCQELYHESNIPRNEILLLGGKAYEQAGHPELAAKCYSGNWPLP
jgi:hypothetical protein